MDQKLKLIGVNELAEVLGVPASWVYSRTRMKGPDSIPSLQLGKYVKFELDKVLDWLKKQNEAEK
ncbi:MAG: helix-turn-helix domain-containing protein [Proteobacteria bacterium]|nr:helix-turn-helix domain-containing protein [Desulfobacteraceae bacterium]MBU4014273.1 helix-turn-helix domain-containing protein [Pseudomonadota bacterium]